MVFVCLFVLFSHLHIVYADSEPSTFFGVEYPIIFENPNSGISLMSYDISGYKVSMGVYLSTGTFWWVDKENKDLSDNSLYRDNDGIIHGAYYISLPDIIERGAVCDFSFYIDYSQGSFEIEELLFQNANSSNINTDYTLEIEFQRETVIAVNLNDVSSSENRINKLYLKFKYKPSANTTVFNTSLSRMSVTEVSQNSLLGNIIEVVKKIGTTIIDLPKNIANSFKSLFNTVVSAVTNLGNFIVDGIKGLFIPTEEDITAMQEKWNTLLSERFGALYQVIELISNYAKAFTSHSKTSITIPSITIPLGDNSFTFGGWTVTVVPEGFGVVFETLKLIISITCTIWFVNGLKNRFEKIVGGADDI